jgi:hypothetical protein
MARKQQSRRCLIVERHAWETGGSQQQLQFVLELARQFFGAGGSDRAIQVRLFLAFPWTVVTGVRDIVISREYKNGTRRTNGFPEMAGFPAGFVFFEETDVPNVYDVWWQTDVAVVAARYSNWSQGGNSQYGRGRLSIIVEAPVPRPIDRIA